MMKKEAEFNNQFNLKQDVFLKGIDLSNWFRYYFILKEAMKLSPKKVLEIGAGNEVVKDFLQKITKNYKVMDINPKLKPDILSDIREFRQELKENFDCIICADVLEHMPLDDLEKNLTNIFNYLTENGKAIITIPHRRARIMIVTPLSYQKPKIFELPPWLKSNPESFFKQIVKRKIWIDPNHCWEIGDGKVRRKDVEKIIKKVGFKIDKFEKILQVDFWILNKK